MELLFKNETKFGEEEQNIFKRFFFFKYNNDSLLLVPVFIIFFSILAILSIIFLIKRFVDNGEIAMSNIMILAVSIMFITIILNGIFKKDVQRNIAIVVLIFFTILLVVNIFTLVQVIRDNRTISIVPLVIYFIIIIWAIISILGTKQKQSLKKEIIWSYEFYDEYMMIITDISTLKIIYKEQDFVKNICKYKGYIFLIQSEKSGWMINENNFTVGEKEDFDKYLQDKFNKTFLNSAKWYQKRVWIEVIYKFYTIYKECDFTWSLRILNKFLIRM